MRVERNNCECEKPEPIQSQDEFNSIHCNICWEILSYEKSEKKKFFKIKHLQPTIVDFIEVLNKIRPDVLC